MFSADAAVAVYGRHDNAALAPFAEGQRVRVAGIGVVLGVLRSMIVPKKGVAEPCFWNLGSVEWRMLRFAFLLFREPCALGAVKERQVQAGFVDVEVLKEVPGVLGCQVGAAPQCESGGQLAALQARLSKHLHIRAPIVERVDAVRPVPVMVARRQEHLDRRQPGECVLEKRCGIGSRPLVLVEIAPAKDRICLGILGQLDNTTQGVPQALAPPARRVAVRTSPGESCIEMQIREVDDLEGVKHERMMP